MQFGDLNAMFQSGSGATFAKLKMVHGESSMRQAMLFTAFPWHFSNGGIKQPNGGVNFAVARLAYKF